MCNLLLFITMRQPAVGWPGVYSLLCLRHTTAGRRVLDRLKLVCCKLHLASDGLVFTHIRGLRILQLVIKVESRFSAVKMDNLQEIPAAQFYGNSRSSSEDDYSSDDSEIDPNFQTGSMHSDTSDTEDEEPESEETISAVGWKHIEEDTDLSQLQSKFTPLYNEEIRNVNLLPSDEPVKYFLLFVEDILETSTNQTNIYANQVIADTIVSRQSRLNNWVPTTIDEMKKFFGLLLWMGVVKYPQLHNYWSTKTMYHNKTASSTMSRNRFEILLRMWHFANNAESNGDRIHKVRKLVEDLQSKFQKYKVPGRCVCVDESMVPFRGRLKFRQYIPGKRHKYGVKLFKLCDNSGYTYSLKIYQGKGTTPDLLPLSTNVVMELGHNYLAQGRIFITDNFYTSIELAETLLSNNTHLVGTLRKNRKGVPREIASKRLRKGDIVGMYNNKGIVVAKWKDKRDVLVLSTTHSLEIVNTGKRNRYKEEVLKPQIIIDYNRGKSGIDLSDQYSSYSTVVRRSIKWYHKVAMELIFGTAVVNSFIIYKAISNRKISIVEYREQLIEGLLGHSTRETSQPVVKHQLAENDSTDARNRKIRKRCTSCYKANRDRLGSREADKSSVTPRVVTFCKNCPEQPYLCATCFVAKHS